jgi:hypothetical protein
VQIPPTPRHTWDTFSWKVRPNEGMVRGAFFSDGSAFDLSAHGGILRRLGWSFAAVDDDGVVLAAASGTPPEWVTCVHGAELWGFCMALRHALPGSGFFTDCQAVERIFKRGAAIATASNVLYARAWCIVFAAFDPDEVPALTWMPAHTAVSAVGYATLGDGSVLTQWHRDANEVADALAKSAALLSRVSASVRAQFDKAACDITDLGVAIGLVTQAANAFVVNGVTLRDSTAARPRKPVGYQRPVRALAIRPVPLGGHDLRLVGKMWRCCICKHSTATFSSLCGRKCAGSAVAAWAARAVEDAARGRSDGGGHRRMLSGDVLWCRVCGAFSATRAVGLAKACTGRPGGSGRLARLLRGCHPVTGVDIGVPLAEDGDLSGFERAIVRPVRIVRSVAQAAETSPSFAAVRARVRAREAASLLR